jgi:ribosome maturation protein Sdo1
VQIAPLAKKGRFTEMFKKINIIREILRHKNSQIRAERQKTEAEQSMNVILSAYLAMLVDDRGTVTIPKSRISEALGKYRVIASSDDENYVITVAPNEYDIGALRGEE